eukprot:5492995-Pyramimonas_sp.AAC.1
MHLVGPTKQRRRVADRFDVPLVTPDRSPTLQLVRDAVITGACRSSTDCVGVATLPHICHSNLLTDPPHRLVVLSRSAS